MFFLFFLAQMNNFVYLCRRNKNNLKVLALFISYYNMDERTIKIVNEARWTDGQIVRNRLDDISYDPMGCQEDLIMRIARENAKRALFHLQGEVTSSPSWTVRSKTSMTSISCWRKQRSRLSGRL